MEDSLPYQIIARWNGLVKEVPNDPNNWNWVDVDGNRYVETNLGFVNAIQYNAKLQMEKIQGELDSISSDYLSLKKKYEQLLNTHKPIAQSNDNIGRGSKRFLRAILDSRNSDEEKIVEIRRYFSECK